VRAMAKACMPHAHPGCYEMLFFWAQFKPCIYPVIDSNRN
jgi:hypothetical protein